MKGGTPLKGKRLDLYVPISKIDVEKRLVYGSAADETPDYADEIFDYDTSKPHFESWSGEIEKTTDGKSKGNIRAMHSSIAAGKVVEIAFDDDSKAIPICVKVVDDNEWDKCLEGVYTGFSIGGRYVKRWPDPTDLGKMRYTAKPTEISLVDRPCNPSATFEMIKADGVEVRQFKTKEVSFVEVKEVSKEVLDQFKKDLAGGELAKAFSYEEIKDRLRGAINDKIRTPFNCGYFWIEATYEDRVIIEGDLDGDGDSDKYSVPYTIDAEGVITLGDNIQQVRVEYVPAGDETPTPGIAATVTAEKTEPAGDLTKGAGEEGTPTEPENDLSKQDEGDQTPPAEEPETAEGEVAKTEVTTTISAVDAEAFAKALDGMELALEPLAKAGAKHSKETLDKLRKIHHDLAEMGAACSCEKCAGLYSKSDKPEDLTKTVEPGQSQPTEIENPVLSKALEKVAALEKAYNGLKEANEAMQKTIKDLQEQPMPGGPLTNTSAVTVEKGMGGGQAKTPIDQQIEVIKGLMNEANDPLLKQAYGMQITKLEVLKVQTGQ